MRIARLFVLCFSLLGLPVFAATVPNLYQVHEPVSSQQPGSAMPDWCEPCRPCWYA